jgi:uncharacterized membrane protein
MKKIGHVLLATAISFSLLAQDSTKPNDFLNDADASYAKIQMKEVGDEAKKTLNEIKRSDEFNQRLNEYSIKSLDHRQAVFAWQLFANKLIFVIVMLIVIMGLVLSYLHFKKSLTPGVTDANTELEMSASGIKMNSSVIGLIILVLAIAFLYLYLIHVFPISEFNVDTKAVPELAK